MKTSHAAPTDSSGPIVGIDLGTTYASVAVMEQGHPVLLPNALGERLTPSAVSMDEQGQVLVGAAARARAVTRPKTAVIGFKRDMGRDIVYPLSGAPDGISPVQASALVLRQLKEDAEVVLGQAVTEAVITVPAYFGEHQRRATKDAAALAGLRVERIINEPTAAALAYGLHHRTETTRAVVWDLGGGTFDVTVVELLGGVIEVQATAGDARLGGDDFRDILGRWLEERLLGEHDVSLDQSASSRDRARLREAAERAKHGLSSHTQVTVSVSGVGVEARDVSVSLSRVDAEDMWEELLERMRAVVLRALRDAGCGVGGIDEVLMVGGATRIPCVVQLAAQLFGRLPRRTLAPDEAVAQGAAIQAALKAGDAAVEDLIVTDIAPFSMGIATSTEMGGHRVSGLFAPVLERGTVIPASRVKRFSTVTDYQRVIKLEVYQGERSMCRDNTLLGQFCVERLDPAPAGEQAVDVRFTYDLNGLLEVEAVIVGTDRRESLVIEGSPGRLSEAELARALEAMEGIKFHPRKALPNATALERADALFGELTGPDRERLGAGLAAFRTALESQQAERIERQRELLNALIRLFKSRY